MHSFLHCFKMISTEIEVYFANVVLIVKLYKILCYFSITHNFFSLRLNYTNYCNLNVKSKFDYFFSNNNNFFY